LTFVDPSGLCHPCMSFVHSCILLLVVFLALCIFVVGGVAYVYLVAFSLIGSGYILDVCVSLYIFVSCLLFSCFSLCFVFLCFCCWLSLLNSQSGHCDI